MDWIFIAIVSGTIMTAPFQTEEGCLGKKAKMEKDKIATNSKCIDMRLTFSYTVISPNTVMTPAN